MDWPGREIFLRTPCSFMPLDSYVVWAFRNVPTHELLSLTGAAGRTAPRPLISSSAARNLHGSGFFALLS